MCVITDRYYYTMVDDPRGNLVEASIQLLFILLDYTPPTDITQSMQQREDASAGDGVAITAGSPRETSVMEPGMRNLFCSFVSRLHQSDVSVKNKEQSVAVLVYTLAVGSTKACVCGIL